MTDATLNWCETCRHLTAGKSFEHVTRCRDHEGCVLRVTGYRCVLCGVAKELTRRHGVVD